MASVAARVGVEDVGAHEVHHTVPRCLLSLRDRADAHPEFDGEGIQLWLDYELEALLYGIDPDISRDDLAGLFEASTVQLPREEHRYGHSEASDFVRWGRRGGLGNASAVRDRLARAAGEEALGAHHRGGVGGSVRDDQRRAVLMRPLVNKGNPSPWACAP